MVKTAELDEPEDDPRLPQLSRAAKTTRLDSSGVPELAKGKRRPVVQSELTVWYALLGSERQTALEEAVKGAKDWSPEALLHVSRQAYESKSRKFFNLAFEAFSRRATPLLLSQAWGTAANERHDQVQEVLLHTFTAIQTGTTDYAETNFASFAERKSISLHRARASRHQSTRQGPPCVASRRGKPPTASSNLPGLDCSLETYSQARNPEEQHRSPWQQEPGVQKLPLFRCRRPRRLSAFESIAVLC